jgi:hypothetical protein
VDTPEHVQHLESGGLACRHCGGKVTAEGYSDGGEVGPMLEGETDETPQQFVATEKLREGSGFVDAVRRRRKD